MKTRHTPVSHRLIRSAQRRCCELSRASCRIADQPVLFFDGGGGCTSPRRGKRELRVDVRREFPAVASSLADIRETTASSARETAASDTVVAAAVQAVHEAAANAVVHAYGGGNGDDTIELAGRHGGGWVRLTGGDRGEGQQPPPGAPRHGPGVSVNAPPPPQPQPHAR